MTATSLRGHPQSSEGLLDMSPPPALTPDQHSQATAIFNQIVSRYEPLQASRTSPSYKFITLLRTFHESVVSKDSFLYHFFSFIDEQSQQDLNPRRSAILDILPRFEDIHLWSSRESDDFQDILAAFSEFLVNNFFLPLKASGRRTPQPTPTSLSLSDMSDGVTGTPTRLSCLRKQCLIRDRYRCVISRKLDDTEAKARWAKYGPDSKDEDGLLLKDEIPGFLQVAHILPHSLTSSSKNSQLSESKKIALEILKMFDSDACSLIAGKAIDGPANAMSLTLDWHQRFGAFEISFQPSNNQSPHSYKIDYADPNYPFRDPVLPVVRQLYMTSSNTKTIDPPSPRLLAIHHAIACILHLSGAGDYIDHVIRDMEEVSMEEDGSAALGVYVRLKVDDWLNGVAVC
ncbi:hypothetical protein RBB50_005517 [Rhinocladiella similis]